MHTNHANNRQKKILLIAYYFPPYGSPQTIRWTHLVRHLTAKGWLFDVLTLRPLPNRPDYDPGMLALLDDRYVNIYRTYPGPIASSKKYPTANAAEQDTPAAPPAQSRLRPLLKRAYRAMVRPLLIPDDEVEWIPWATRTGRELLSRNHYDVVISSAPPMSNHLAAYWILKNQSVPLVADYGDPWVFNPMQRVPAWRQALDRRLETMVLRRTAKIIVTTENCRQTYLNHYRWLSPEQVKVIPMGAGDSTDTPVAPSTHLKGNRLRLVHTGSFYEEGRDATPLLEALAQLPHLPLELVLVGNLSERYRNMIGKLGLTQRITCTGYVNHQKALDYQREADLLVYFSNVSPFQIPGKLFEYLEAGRPILGITYNKEDDGSRLITDNRRGIVAARDPKEIAEEIRRLHEAWQAGRLEDQFNLAPVTDFRWDKLADQLHEVLMETINNPK